MDIKEQVKQRIDEFYPQIVAFRRDLHAHPELSGQEDRTSRRIAEELEKLGITPIDFTQRDQTGRSLNKDQLNQVNEVATEMLSHPEEWSERILAIREKNIYNLGHCGEVIADYIIGRLTERQTKA